jgi:parallel beta-helix repeat protein
LKTARLPIRIPVRPPIRTILSVCAFFFFIPGTVLYAGPLNPPAGPVASTYKTLTEVEPRTPVQSLAGSATAVHVIAQPGSYYLAGDIVVPAGKSGISIQAQNVTLDLGGLAIAGQAGSLRGIESTASHATVRNGLVRGCGQGGVEFLNTSDHLIQNVHVRDCGLVGIGVQDRSKVERCTARACPTGIAARFYCTVESCEAYENGAGISINQFSTVRACKADNNNGDAFYATGYGLVFFDCTASFNLGMGFRTGSQSKISRCQSTFNFGIGFDLAEGSTIADSAVKTDNPHGIRVTEFCRVQRCNVTGTGAPLSAGILVTATGNLIEECSITDSGIGISVAGVGNKVIRNTCSANYYKNWDVVAGNYCYVIVGPTSGAVNGNAGGVPSGATDPNANFSY